MWHRYYLIKCYLLPLFNQAEIIIYDLITNGSLCNDLIIIKVIKMKKKLLKELFTLEPLFVFIKILFISHRMSTCLSGTAFVFAVTQSVTHERLKQHELRRQLGLGSGRPLNTSLFL